MFSFISPPFGKPFLWMFAMVLPYANFLVNLKLSLKPIFQSIQMPYSTSCASNAAEFSLTLCASVYRFSYFFTYQNNHQYIAPAKIYLYLISLTICTFCCRSAMGY